MRRLDRLKLDSTQTQAFWQDRAIFFVGASVAGTFLALLVLILDGWIDALAIYIVCSLSLAILLSQFAARQEQLRAEPPVNDGSTVPGNRQNGLIFKQLSWFWSKGVHRSPRSDKIISPSVLSKMTSTD